MGKIELEEIDELKEIARQIRREITNPKMLVYTNLLNQLIIETEVENVETMSTFMSIIEELKLYHSRYLEGYDSNFEFWMNRNSPVIYCTYERNKID